MKNSMTTIFAGKNILSAIGIAAVSGIFMITGVMTVAKFAQPTTEQPVLTTTNEPQQVVTDAIVDATAEGTLTEDPQTVAAYTITDHGTTNSCHVTLNGITYDVTNHPSWRGCFHQGVRGGQDISAAFPHSASYLSGLPIVDTSATDAAFSSVAQPTPAEVTQPAQAAPTVTTNNSPPTAAATDSLAAHDGTNGSCYIILNGTTYDVTGHPSWRNCTHHGVRGGRDISSIFPHSSGYLAGIPIVAISDNARRPSSARNANRDDDEYEDHEEDDD